MTRAIADTNAVVSSALFQHSTPARAVRFLEENAELLASEQTLAELYEVLRRPKFQRWLSVETREQVLTRYTALVEIISITEHIVACRHPKDDKFLSLAVCGNADLILTGENDLLTLHPFRGIDILSPKAYLAQLS